MNKETLSALTNSIEEVKAINATIKILRETDSPEEMLAKYQGRKNYLIGFLINELTTYSPRSLVALKKLLE